MDEFISDLVAENIEQAAAAAATPRRRCVERADAFSLSDQLFKKNYRLSKELAEMVITMVEPFICHKTIDTKTKVS